jgi:hypothetical protein
MKPDMLIALVVALCILIVMAVWPIAYLTAKADCPKCTPTASDSTSASGDGFTTYGGHHHKSYRRRLRRR